MLVWIPLIFWHNSQHRLKPSLPTYPLTQELCLANCSSVVSVQRYKYQYYLSQRGSTIWLTIWSIWWTHNLILTYERNNLHYLQEYCFAVLFYTVMRGKGATIGWWSGVSGVKNSGTKARNHRISDQIWKGPLDVICSNLPPKARSLTSIFQDHVQMLFEHLKEWRCHNLSGQTVPVLGLFIVEKCSLIFRGNLLPFSFCSLSPVLFSTLNHSCIFFFFF